MKVPFALLILATGAQACASDEQDRPFTLLDFALRERADALASRAAEFKVVEEFTAAADLYREAVETLPVDRRNGSRFHAYRESYAEAIERQNLIEPVSLPGGQFGGEEGVGFDPTRFVTTIIPKVEFEGLPFDECLDWLETEFYRLNPDADELVIRFEQEVGGLHRRLASARQKFGYG